MDVDVLEDVVSKAKNEEQRKKVSFFEVLGDHENAEVPDPYWGDMQEFEDVYHFGSWCDAVLNKISK
jgi:protein-tyrosine phosphatase